MSNFPSYKVVKVASLVPYARNSRTHSDYQINQICSSIEEFGFTNPVLIDGDGGIVAGHGRVMAAQKLGMEEVPAIVLESLTPEQKKAYVIADNKLALNAGWDLEMLKLEFEDMQSLGLDLSLTGFGDGEIAQITLDIERGENDAYEEWQGMPEFEQGDAESFRRIIVHFDCQDDVNEFFSIIGQSHTDKTKSIWYPEKQKENLKAYGYEQSED